ncbi:hypothetical protein JCM8097_000084 [Rhodosporidiobolus ruineniae]
MLAEVSSYLEVPDLISLAKVSKQFHKLVLSPSTRSYWTALRRCDGYELPSGMDELSFCLFVYGKNCQLAQVPSDYLRLLALLPAPSAWRFATLLVLIDSILFTSSTTYDDHTACWSVWFSHKLVCGTKPFAFPPLQKDEVDFLQKHLEIEFIVDKTGETGTLGQRIRELYSACDPAFKHFSPKDVLENLQSSQPRSTLFTFAHRNELVCRIRALYYEVYQSYREEHPLPGLPGLGTTQDQVPNPQPVALAARMTRNLAGRLNKAGLPPFPTDKAWYITFQHHLLIFATIQHLQSERFRLSEGQLFSQQGRPDLLWGYLSATMRAVSKIADDMKEENPVESQVVLDMLDGK